MKLVLLAALICIFTTSPAAFQADEYFPPPVIHPVQCYADPYIEKVLDALEYVESSNNPLAFNINKAKKNRAASYDEGAYQLNSANYIIFSNAYNDGRRYNPYDRDVARRIARQLILDNLQFTRSMKEALVAYNCGIGRWMKKAPIESIKFAENVLRRIE
jgi:hypothetical protein